ncbi:MAG: alcohol dehydrogenase catalytic domain-containing protein, partial [Chloroflexota bacterium]|nr:alcohol dehydrogenase catalytic domain-containing protein [Chloroflexota bacterium]
MRVAKYYRHDDIRVEEMPVPKIGPGELLVQVKACGLCGSDAMTWYADEKAPTVLGHEPTGVVVEVGQAVNGFKVGDRVFVHHHVACLVCHYCRRGNYSMCPTFSATHIDPGGFAEYIRVPALNVERDVLLLPEEVSFEEGTLIEPVACAVRGMRRVRVEPGDTVLVLGAGVSGLIFAQLARLWGAGSVVVVDFVQYRLDMAKRLGADLTTEAGEGTLNRLEAFNEGRGADLVIVTPGSIRAMEEGIQLVGKGGTVLLYAPSYPGERLPLDTND